MHASYGTITYVLKAESTFWSDIHPISIVSYATLLVVDGVSLFVTCQSWYRQKIEGRNPLIYSDVEKNRYKLILFLICIEEYPRCFRHDCNITIAIVSIARSSYRLLGTIDFNLL